MLFITFFCMVPAGTSYFSCDNVQTTDRTVVNENNAGSTNLKIKNAGAFEIDLSKYVITKGEPIAIDVTCPESVSCFGMVEIHDAYGGNYHLVSIDHGRGRLVLDTSDFSLGENVIIVSHYRLGNLKPASATFYID